MRILHTADWHLGHTLRDHSREREHEHFLSWLVDTVVEREVDALLIAGDVFESANPPPFAWRMWFEFLGALKRRRPAVQVVVIAGNHDSAARLEAPRDLLAAFDVRIIGRIRRDGERLVTDDLLVPLRGAAGTVGALCVAIPFLRASDVLAFAGLASTVAAKPAVDAATDSAAEGQIDDAGSDSGPEPVYELPMPGRSTDVDTATAEDPLIRGMRGFHAELFRAARAMRQPGQALVAMAHGYLVGGMLSELSERKVLGGNQHALPVDLFPTDCDYVALGHLHRPQPVAGRESVRYSGSPIPLSMPEREHPHHVVFADLADGGLAKTWSLRVPRLVPLLRIPERGASAPADALAAVAELPPRDPEIDDELRPLLEVAVRLAVPAPGIGERVAAACAEKNVRLTRVDITTTGASSGVEPTAGPRDLSTLAPEQLFRWRYARDHRGAVPAPLMAAFRELLDEVEHGPDEPLTVPAAGRLSPSDGSRSGRPIVDGRSGDASDVGEVGEGGEGVGDADADAAGEES